MVELHRLEGTSERHVVVVQTRPPFRVPKLQDAVLNELGLTVEGLGLRVI